MSIGRLKIFIILTTLCLVAGCMPADRYGPIDVKNYEETIRVACVGNSITYGAGIENRVKDSYPAQLGRMLGDRWETRNFGVSGATMLKKGDNPYWNTAFNDAIA